jgi:hypothetical protein
MTKAKKKQAGMGIALDQDGFPIIETGIPTQEIELPTPETTNQQADDPAVENKANVDTSAEVSAPVCELAAGQQASTAHVHKASKGNEKAKEEKNKKKERHLSARERKAVALRVSGLSQKDSLISAGYSESVATTRAHDVLGKPLVLKALEKAFKDAGLDVIKLAQKHLQLLEAKKVISTVVLQPGEAVSAKGETMDIVEVNDGQVQVKALELAYKVRGDFAPERHAVVTESYADRIKRIRGES